MTSIFSEQGGPDPEKLARLWLLLLALRDAHPSVGIAALDRWPLIPCRGSSGTITRVAQRPLIFCPPPPIRSTLPAPQPMDGPNTKAAAAETQAGAAPSADASTRHREDIQPSRDSGDQERHPLLHAEQPAEPSRGQVRPEIGEAAAVSSANPAAAGSTDVSMVSAADGSMTWDGQGQRPAGPWEWLLPILERLALPVLDPRFSMLTSLCALDEDLSEQDTILGKLQLCGEAGLFQVDTNSVYFN